MTDTDPKPVDPGVQETAPKPVALEVPKGREDLSGAIDQEEGALSDEANKLAATGDQRLASLGAEIEIPAEVRAQMTELNRQAEQVAADANGRLEALRSGGGDGATVAQPQMVDSKKAGSVVEANTDTTLRNPPKIDDDPGYTKWIKYLSKDDFSYTPEEIMDKAHGLFAQEHPEEAQKYREAEEKGIWDNPNDDPIVKKVESDISRAVAGEVHAAQNGQRGAIARDESRRESLNFSTKANVAESNHQWINFAMRYPEKAQAYAEKDPAIAKALEFVRSKQNEVQQPGPAPSVVRLKAEPAVVTESEAAPDGESVEDSNVVAAGHELTEPESIDEQPDLEDEIPAPTDEEADEGEEGVLATNSQAQTAEANASVPASEKFDSATNPAKIKSRETIAPQQSYGEVRVRNERRKSVITLEELGQRLKMVEGDRTASLANAALKTLNRLVPRQETRDNFLLTTMNNILRSEELRNALHQDAKSFTQKMRNLFGPESRASKEIFSGETESPIWQLFSQLDPNNNIDSSPTEQIGNVRAAKQTEV